MDIDLNDCSKPSLIEPDAKHQKSALDRCFRFSTKNPKFLLQKSNAKLDYFRVPMYGWIFGIRLFCKFDSSLFPKIANSSLNHFCDIIVIFG